MKLLLDANISWKLTNILMPVFGECAHVDLIGLKVPARDRNIWNYALENGYNNNRKIRLGERGLFG